MIPTCDTTSVQELRKRHNRAIFTGRERELREALEVMQEDAAVAASGSALNTELTMNRSEHEIRPATMAIGRRTAAHQQSDGGSQRP